MQQTSALWKTLVADPNTTREVKAEINGVTYNESHIYNMSITGSLYQAPTIGKANAREIEMQIIPQGETIPTMAKVVPYVRLVNGNQTSEWLKKGEFFIDTRSVDSASGTMTIHGYDAMLKADRYISYVFSAMLANGGIRYDCPSMVNAIANYMGVEVDGRTTLSTELSVESAFSPSDYDGILLPNNTKSYTMRDVLGFIAAMHGGNWTIADNGKLWLCPFLPVGYSAYEVIGDENGDAISIGGVLISTLAVSQSSGGEASPIALGGAAKSYDSTTAYKPWTGVYFSKNGEEVACAGDGILYPNYAEYVNGRVMAVECPCATEEAASLALGNIRNMSYAPYTATGAIIDPAAELGDLVTKDGAESVAARLDWTFDSLFSADIAAPSAEDIDHEFPHDTPVSQSVRAAIDDTVSTAIATETISIQIVQTLPEDHATQNVLWVIPEDGGFAGGNVVFH